MMGTPGWFFFPSSCPHLLALPPVQAGEMREQPFVPALAPAEPGSVSSSADSTSAELPPDVGMCQAFPTTAATQPEHPSAAGRTTTSAGSHGSGKAGRQLGVGRILPAGAMAG